MKHFAYINHQDFGTFEVMVRHSHREDVEGGWRWVEDPPTKETVRLLIDPQSIINQIGERAAKSKSGRSKFMAGAILVHHIRGQR